MPVAYRWGIQVEYTELYLDIRCDALRRDVERSITVERSEQLEARCTQLEGEVTKLRVERDKHKEVASIATKQAETIQVPPPPSLALPYIYPGRP